MALLSPLDPGSGGNPALDFDRQVLWPLRDPTGRSVASPAQASSARTEGMENSGPLSWSHGNLDGEGCSGAKDEVKGADGHVTVTECTDNGVATPLLLDSEPRSCNSMLFPDPLRDESSDNPGDAATSGGYTSLEGRRLESTSVSSFSRSVAASTIDGLMHWPSAELLMPGVFGKSTDVASGKSVN